ncbi:MAG: carboxylating nicotinate-nucleotide diphosphorylase [Thermoplasmata archaeon]
MPRRSPRSSAVARDPNLRAIVAQALREDRVRSDLTTRAVIPGRVAVRARITSQSKGVLSGIAVAREVARQAGVHATAQRRDGDSIRPGTTVLVLDGDARAILGIERTLLNFLMHLSGIASSTADAVRAVGVGPGHPRIYATRKTLPGLRDLEKAAVVHGGGWPHRRDLSEAVLIKNNHLAVVTLAIALDRVRRGLRGPVQVEVRSARAAVTAAQLGADRLLIDNASPTRAHAIIRRLESQGLRAGRWIELSGGITPANAKRFRAAGADALSLGALTHSAPALPFHLSITSR